MKAKTIEHEIEADLRRATEPSDKKEEDEEEDLDDNDYDEVEE